MHRCLILARSHSRPSGRGGSEGCETPQNIEALNGLGVCQIECGAQFSLALTRDTGEVWTWGKGDYFRLGHGSDTHVRLPQLVEGESAFLRESASRLEIGSIVSL